jgi:vancomycin resistance protein YoaR
VAARSGAGQVELSTVRFPAEVTVESLGVEDISHVLASFETKYAVNDAERNFNLKLAASKLNGYVLRPGVEFSFNDVVGDRTEKEGYKIAHVITAGEMVDGLAGGTCQISTTLHGAAFFAGIGIDKALPHSRPSTYVTMGLDATVVYPHVDVKLSNPYDFPVVIHYKVAHGTARVEILGKERPWDEIVYEREVVEKLDFDTVTREDNRMPVGTMQVDQHGFYGYKLNKIRKYYKDGKVVKRDKWLIRYPPVTEYVRTGTNPDPNLAPPKSSKQSRLKEPATGIFRLSQ